MEAEKLYDCDRVAQEWTSKYINNSVEFRKFNASEKAKIIDEIKNMMVSLCVFYEKK